MKRYTILLVIIFCLLHTAKTQRLVMPGDHPDPSVVKIGDTYYASATSSNWAPAFPILKSKDLEQWETAGHVFEKLPDWADYYFWAPEISYDNGKVYVYYTAHKKGGNLCVAVAVADKPEGPYKDLGPITCQEVGSIDGFPVRDESGKLHLIWKEDGNSVNKPTPIWCMEMSEDRTKLIGEKKELFRNDVPWEANLVEGVSIARHNGYFIAFYSAAGCCGTGCTYKMGIARAKKLMGPWEKYSSNPVMSGTGDWICPGHGTPVEREGKNYFLYHGYNRKTSVFTGREGLLMEFRYTDDNWVEFVPDTLANSLAMEVADITDEFDKKKISMNWEWSVFDMPAYQLKKGMLIINADDSAGAFFGQKTLAGDYSALVKLDSRHSTASSGLAVIGNEKNMLRLLYRNGEVVLSRLSEGKEDIIDREPVTRSSNASWAGTNNAKKNKSGDAEWLWLRADIAGGNRIKFSYSFDGRMYREINDKELDASMLPPWDRSIRVGPVAVGESSAIGIFDAFYLKHHGLKY